MLPTRRHLAALLLFLATASFAQQPRTLVLLDPAHGGADTGARLPNNLLEKDIALALSARLKTALATANFTVLATRDADTALTPDQRAQAANHVRPAACLLLHASADGTPGVHLVTSALPAATEPLRVIPWDTAQAASLPQSLRLANALGLALLAANLPVTLTQASLRPLDNLTCPAVVIEIAPLASPEPAPVSDAAYQQRVAQAIAAALTTWRTRTGAAQ